MRARCLTEAVRVEVDSSFVVLQATDLLRKTIQNFVNKFGY
jgi:hypothetical protein